MVFVHHHLNVLSAKKTSTIYVGKYFSEHSSRILCPAGGSQPLLRLEKHDDLAGPLVGLLADPEKSELAEEGGGDRVASPLRPLFQLQEPGDLGAKAHASLALGIWRSLCARRWDL